MAVEIESIDVDPMILEIVENVLDDFHGVSVTDLGESDTAEFRRVIVGPVRIINVGHDEKCYRAAQAMYFLNQLAGP